MHSCLCGVLPVSGIAPRRRASAPVDETGSKISFLTTATVLTSSATSAFGHDSLMKSAHTDERSMGQYLTRNRVGQVLASEFRKSIAYQPLPWPRGGRSLDSSAVTRLGLGQSRDFVRCATQFIKEGRFQTGRENASRTAVVDSWSIDNASRIVRHRAMASGWAIDGQIHSNRP